MATQRKTKKPGKTTSKFTGKTAKKITASKKPPKKQMTAPRPKIVKPTEAPPKPANKVHPFAHFMKGRISGSHHSSAPMLKISSHETYRKKAI